MNSGIRIEFGALNREGERRTAWVMWLTIATMILEIAAGWITGSMALLADGWHMGTRMRRPWESRGIFAFPPAARDPRFTFGTFGKVGILTAFGSAIVLGLVAVMMFWESGQRLWTPTPIRFDEALLVALIGLAVNLASAWLLGNHGHTPAFTGHADHMRHDHNLRAAYFHVLADAVTSVLAIAALLAARQWGWMWADPLMGISPAAPSSCGGPGAWRAKLARFSRDGDLAPAEADAVRRAEIAAATAP